MADLNVGGARVHGNAKHGATCGGVLTPEYKTWSNILRRCYTKSNSRYPEYGAMGVKMCDRWRLSFPAFVEDMGPRPSAKHTIDRIDNAKGYEPGNCRWVTMREQTRNLSRNINITWNGRTMCAVDWASETGIPRWTVVRRYRRGWPPEKIFSHDIPRPPSPTQKLDADKVRQIRRRFADGERAVLLAREFGVDRGAIYNITTRTTWKNVQ